MTLIYTFVIDLHTLRRGVRVHYGTLFLEQPRTQAYWVAGLDHHEHGQMTTIEMNDYIDQLQVGNFEEVTRNEINYKRPDKYFMVLSKNHNWNVEEIIVVNDFMSCPALEQLVKELKLSDLAHRLLIEDWETTKKWVNKRGNFQLNHGSNHLDMRDSSKIAGMNLARDHVRPKNMVPGLDGDATMEDTLVRMQVTVTKIFDHLAVLFRKDRVYQDVDRRRLFASHTMKERNLDVDSFRADAGAFLYSGLLFSRANGVHSVQCSFHCDSHNDHRGKDGMNQNICINQLVEMNYPNRSKPVIGRAGMNQFMKECNGTSVEKIKKTKELCCLVKKFMLSRGVKGVDNLECIDWSSILNEVERTAKFNQEDFAVLSANANKDCHYSWFVHVVFTVIMPVYGWNLYVLVEAIYAMSLTPSAVGWKKGVEYAILAKGNGRNFFTNFVYELVSKDGSVANHFGKRARHQVASGALISNHAAMVSCQNCLLLFQHANLDDCDTRKLYGDFGSNPFKFVRGRCRGARNVKDLTAHDIVNVATKVGIITNKSHIRNITIARNTETARRLSKFGVVSDAHLREIVYMLSLELEINDHQIVENMICETLRLLEGGGTNKYVGVDTIGVDQPLYQFKNNTLMRVTRNGSSEINLVEVKKNHPPREYDPIYRWWEMSEAHPETTLGDDYDLVLTKNSKVMKKYLDRKRC